MLVSYSENKIYRNTDTCALTLLVFMCSASFSKQRTIITQTALTSRYLMEKEFVVGRKYGIPEVRRPVKRSL